MVGAGGTTSADDLSPHVNPLLPKLGVTDGVVVAFLNLEVGLFGVLAEVRVPVVARCPYAPSGPSYESRRAGRPAEMHSG